MKTMVKAIFGAIVLMAGVFFIGGTTVSQTASDVPYIENRGDRGSVDWSNGVIHGTGYGVRPERITNPGKARLMAREAALADAYRAIAFIVSGVAVDGNTTVRDHEEESQEIKLSVHAFIRNARIVSEADLPDGTYEVTLELPIWGENGLGRAVRGSGKQTEPVLKPAPQIDEGQEPVGRISEPQITPVVEQPEPFKAQEASGQPYTGLVIYARGLGVEPCMSPKILFPDGSEVWGTMQIDPDLVNSYGIVAYYKTLGKAMKNERTGDNPLVIKAIGKSGKVNGDVVVSEEDGKKILAENVRGGFLEKLGVVFLIDPAEKRGEK